MNDLEVICFIAAPSVIVLFGLILVLISQIFSPDPYTLREPPRHLGSHSEAEVIEGIVDNLENYPQVGRRGRYSAVRNMRVEEDWQPYIGDKLVTILTQSTAEFMFVKRPVQQLTDPFQRAQWATNVGAVA